MVVRRVVAVIVVALTAASVGVLAGPAEKSTAAPLTTVVSDGWEWQVLSGETALFGVVTPPVNSDFVGLGVRASSPALLAPELPILVSFFSQQRWTFSVSSVVQSTVDGPVTVTATASGTGGTVSVLAVIDGGSLDYTVTLPSNLTTLLGIDYDPVADGYTQGELLAEQAGDALSELSGWLAGSATHHSFAWSFDQLSSDANQSWIAFIESTSASAPLHEQALLPAASTDGLLRAYFFADGPNVPATPADTWIARISLEGGVGCAGNTSSLAAAALSLRDATVPGSIAASDGCLTVAPISATLGQPIDITVPIALNPALSSTAWRAITGAEELVTGPLPAGLAIELVRNGSQLSLRIYGTPTAAGTTNVTVALGADSASVGVDLIDAVRGTVSVSVVPALAPTGAASVAPLGLVAAMMLVLGAVALVLRRRLV